MNTINDIINQVSDKDLDTVITALTNRKKIYAKSAVFETLFNSGHILEVQYNNGSLIYLDKIADVFSNTIRMTMLGTNICVGIELDNQDAIAFSADAPSFSCSGSKIIINDKVFKIDNLVSCKLTRLFYSSSVGGHTPVEHDTMKRLADCRKTFIENEKANKCMCHVNDKNISNNKEVTQEQAQVSGNSLYKVFEDIRTFFGGSSK